MKDNILITGASSGIGHNIYTELSPMKRIFTIGRSGLEGAKDHFLCDVTQDPLPDIEEPFHGLVYCPGSINLKPFRSLSDDAFINDYTINVLGAVRVIRHYLKNLQAGGSSSVVLFSTVAVGRGMAFHSSIAAAKGAVEGLMRSLAAEFAPAIRFNAIAPSLTETPLSSRLLRNEKQREAAELRHPLKRIGRPSDIGNTVKFLLSEESSWISGQVLHVDGGLSALS